MAELTAQKPETTFDGMLDGDVRAKKIKLLEAAMKRHQYRAESLIEILHVAQELYGCLEHDLLHYIASKLMVPPSRVYGVATFYHLFSLTPPAKHTCDVCIGTACYVKGGSELLSAASGVAGIQRGQTTADGALSLLSSRCIGACSLAPAVVMDDIVAGHQTQETVTGKLKEWIVNGSE